MRSDRFKKSLFIMIFALVAFVGMQVNFAKLIGTENQFFTLFQFFGPVAGSFLGGMVGAFAVLLAQAVDLMLKVFAGKELDLVSVLRLAPMCFAAYYFSKKRHDALSIAVPLIAMAAFIVHPVGRHVWYFSLYWLIPVVVRLLPDTVKGKLLLKSLGATFAQHAVGGAIWIWTIPMTAAQWNALIPVVAYERLLFAAGIAVSYLAMRAVLQRATKNYIVPATVLNVGNQAS